MVVGATKQTTHFTPSLPLRLQLETMDLLANAFALLDVDVEDDKQQTIGDGNIVNKSDNGKQKGKKSKEMEVVKNEEQNQQGVSLTTEHFKMPLVWIDLEMTGLDVQTDRILEIACVITDGNLTKSVEGPDLVIHQRQECLDKMGEWCQSHHAASGLTRKVLDSTISEENAEKQVLDFVKKYVGTHTPLLAGNSVYVDFLFLKKYMPDLASLFSHVLVDVSSIKALCIRWYPKENRKAPSKENKHRALDDIRESIRELKYYKENIFKVRSKK